MSVRFRAHDTFFIRKGWLTKGIKHVANDPTVFLSHEVNPMDALGIGANMVKALRYWLQVTGLTQESTSGQRVQYITELGRIIQENDPYFEELGTLWLLHYNLATNKEDATAWYFFFNEFKSTDVTRDNFYNQIGNYLRNLGESIAERSIDDDYYCIINTYIPRIKLNPKKYDPEDIIDCPLGELGLLDILNKKNKVFKKCNPKKETLHPLIVFAVILDQYEQTNRNLHHQKGKNEKREIRISEIQSSVCNVGKIFNLDIIALTASLYKLELMNLVKVIRTAGLDVVKIETDMNYYDCIQEYYKTINR